MRRNCGRWPGGRRTDRKPAAFWPSAIYDGGTRTEAATIGGVTLQIVRDWVLKLNTDGPEGLIDRKAAGQPSRLTDAHRAALAAMIESGGSVKNLGQPACLFRADRPG